MDKPEITLEEIKHHCRINHEYDDESLKLFGEAALEVCQQYIGKQFNDQFLLTPAIKVGCLMLITFWFENRGEASDDRSNQIPFPIRSIWNLYRHVGIY
ncbi:head-tail connector protein [Arsenophonus nasoniae]|uniref:Head-tail connector protein n=1 Tax=Arsenophonus nasoniae TaxID=638 RepID=A0A4P7L2L5_9GAMM|nr:head-tail connector protein [Arsenophonus nasoniae]QBY47019.1 Phage gp6-like head-tail connector protein [Arsenophonus nasoniae]WGM09189.1 head-tail connector protein [Arsenophonus nasoniae]